MADHRQYDQQGFSYGLLPRELDPFDEETFEKSKAEFYATITNMRTGQAEYVRITDTWKQMDVIRPSEDRPVGRLEKDPEKLKALHALGMQDEQKQWRWLEEYIGKH